MKNEINLPEDLKAKLDKFAELKKEAELRREKLKEITEKEFNNGEKEYKDK